MPGKLLGLLNNAHHGPAHSPSSQLKSPLGSGSCNASSTSIVVEQDKAPRTKAKSKDKHKDKDSPRRPSIGMDALKRHSLVGRPKSRDGKERKRELETTATINVREETPPLLMIGKADDAPTDPEEGGRNGALLSMRLELDVHVPTMTLTSYEARMLSVVKHAHPVEKHCPDCITHVTELRKWELISAPRVYKKGMHDFPLTYLFPNHLPATVTGPGAIATVEYKMETVAKTSEGEEIKNVKPFVVRRAIIPGQERQSVRVFPPTSVVLNVSLQPVVHPIGEIPINMTVSGIAKTMDRAVQRWRIRKLSWRIEEDARMAVPACPKHAHKAAKGADHEEHRTIGQGELKDGWKCDWDKAEIECEFKAAVNPNSHPVCDMAAHNGLKVRHALILELVVAEEWTPKDRPGQVTPTGAARILKTQFTLVLTDRLGMGIAWDQEQPPRYEDVPVGPPNYPPAPPGYRNAVPYDNPPSPPAHRRGDVADLDASSIHELDLEQGPAEVGMHAYLDDDAGGGGGAAAATDRFRGFRGLTAADLEADDPGIGPSTRAADRPAPESPQPERDEAHGTVG